MKILKYILFTIIGLTVLALIAAALMPKSYTISVSETINRPKAEVYDYLKLFANQKEYSEWTKPDPTLVPVISGTDGTVGSSSYWNSENSDVGEGKQTIAAMSENQINIDLEFIRPLEGKAKVINRFESIDSTTTIVKVDFFTEDKYPFNLPGILIGKPMITKTEKQILKNVKEILESKK